MQVVINSLLTSYTRTGKGSTLLLLHGWGDSAAGLASLQKMLSIKYDVIALDLPGFGGTQPPENSWGIEDYAEFVKVFSAKINIHVQVLAGHSNGGAIAIKALANGLDAKKLVLISSAGIRGEYNGRNKLIRIITKSGKLITSPLPTKVKKQLRATVYRKVGSDMLVAEHLQETFKRVVTDDVRKDAKKLQLPTLLIYGDKDTATPLRYAQQFNDCIKGSKLIVVPGAGHMLPTENTALIVKYMGEFIG